MLTSLRPSQVDIVLMHLQQYGTITKSDAMRYNIHNVADRIMALRRKGHKIKTLPGKTTTYRLDIEEDPLLTKHQFDEVMRAYTEKSRFSYLPHALRELYADYCNKCLPWPVVVKNAIEHSPQLVARFIAFNYFQAEKDKKYQQKSEVGV